MVRTTSAIRPLPDDVAAQIKSSATISSLEHVIIGLFKNSLDASSRRIDIDLDFGRGVCTVEDDGLGIKPGDFLDNGGLGKAYHTSKFGDTNKSHGREGTFLASLAALSILTITSHYHAHRSSATLIYHHTRPAARLVPAPSRYHLANREHGTKVEVHDLFGNMPVRVKQRGLTSSYEKEHQRQWETIRKSIVGSLLAWHSPVAVIVRGPGVDRNIILRNKNVQLARDREDCRLSRPLDPVYLGSVLSQAGYIEPDIRETWIKTTARTPFMTIRGLFSLRPVPSKRIQFLSLGIRYLSPDTGASILYNEINDVFALSSFGTLENPSENGICTRKKIKDRRYEQDGPTKKQLRGTGKGVDRWPMFVIRIEMEEDVTPKGLAGRDILERESTLASIVKVLGAMTTGFLNNHHFRPRTRQDRRRPGSKQNTLGVLENPQSGAKASASQSTSSVTTPRPRSSRETQTARFGDDSLGGGIQLPKVFVDQGRYAEAFSGWSRIKSGTTRGVGDGCLNVKTKVQPPQTTQRGTPSVRSPHQQALQGEPSELIQEDTFTWINPVTKVPSVLNSRTGQSVLHVAKRPLAHNTDGTCEEGALHRVKGMSRIDKLPRCASTSVVPKADSWVGSFLKAWNNPVFSPATEQAIPQVSFEGPTLETPNVLHGRHRVCSHRDIERVFTEASTTLPSSKLSKTGLLNARIISQVDKKFILVLTDHMPHPDRASSTTSSEHQILALIDQHAADERIRIEALLAELCTPPSPETLGLDPAPGIATTLLWQPIAFPIKVQEHRLFDAHAHHFARWGILYELSKPSEAVSSTFDTTTCIMVRYLPPVIAERCRLEPKLLIDLIRREVWKLEEDGRSTRPHIATSSTTPSTDQPNGSTASWLTQLTTCPPGIIDMLNSRACRSAIMFNDELTHGECETLVARLAACQFPFQCAHGRPSMVPLVAVGQGGSGEGGMGAWEEEKERGTFADAWKAWKGS
ncbi:MAG: hypothetical protein LQ339_002780 [Xanthoria mediterranea]|nr:MAG: hypothetical protein LQ339_002780 [Xanthoria mediterranea]